MTVPVPSLGHQADSDTLILYKMGDQFQSTTTAADSAGSEDLTVNGDVPVINGPGGLIETTWARWFSGNSTDTITSGVIGTGTIQQNMVETTSIEHTIECLFRCDDSFPMSGSRGVFAINNSTGETAADDFLMRLQVTTTGALDCFWERAGVDQQVITASTGLISTDSWHVVHVTREDRSGDTSKWTTTIYLDGTLVETFDTDGSHAVGDGSKPQSTSGTADTITVGAGTGPSTDLWLGGVGSIRFVSSVMSPAQITAASNTLLSTGDVTDGLTSFAHWNFNEPPSLVDTSGHGIHALGTRLVYTVGSSLGYQQVDLVGTGGFASAFNSTALQSYWRPEDAAFQTIHGRSLYQYFNDDVATVPEYTIEAFLLRPTRTPGGNSRLAGWADPTGESLATNVLFQHEITPAHQSAWFGEEGAGVDIVQSPANSNLLGVNEATDMYTRIHWAVRVKEDPGNPGEMLIEHFVNGVQMAQHSTGTSIPQGGEDSLGIEIGPWDGWLQDIHISRVARSDAYILADALRRV